MHNILRRSSSLTLKVWQSLNQDLLWILTAPEDPLAVGHSNHQVSLTTSAAVSYIEQTPSSTPDLQGALTSALKCGQSTGIKVLLGGSRRGLSESSASAQWPSCPQPGPGSLFLRQQDVKSRTLSGLQSALWERKKGSCAVKSES